MYLAGKQTRNFKHKNKDKKSDNASNAASRLEKVNPGTPFMREAQIKQIPNERNFELYDRRRSFIYA